MPYENDCAETCAYLIQLGGGSLATSVYSSEKRFLKKLLPKIVTSNGRVLVVDKKVSDTATGHGMVMPQMVHGGPGRAGGGEELGGLRGLSFYMQRTAIQGNKALMERIFGD
jgi:3,4-dehydroadipyl-CoA semialdehyde dehydrogenase